MFERIDQTLNQKQDSLMRRESMGEGIMPVTKENIELLLEKLNQAGLKKSDLARIGIEANFFRSPGPGGQNVNKVETGVRLILKFNEDEIRVISTGERSQGRNLQVAIERLREKLREKLRSIEASQKERVVTKPSKGAEERRLQEKKRQSEKKRSRQQPRYYEH